MKEYYYESDELKFNCEYQLDIEIEEEKNIMKLLN